MMVKTSKDTFIDGVYRKQGEEFNFEGELAPFMVSLEPEAAPVEDQGQNLAAADALLGGQS